MGEGGGPPRRACAPWVLRRGQVVRPGSTWPRLPGAPLAGAVPNPSPMTGEPLVPASRPDPVSGLPCIASMGHEAIRFLTGYLLLLAGHPGFPRAMDCLAGADPATGREVWARFEETGGQAPTGVMATLHDGPPDAPGSRLLPGGGFVANVPGHRWDEEPADLAFAAGEALADLALRRG